MKSFVTLSALALVGRAIADSYLLANSSITSQIRLAYTGDSGMTVSWNTFEHLSRPTVKYGLSPDAMTQTATSSESVTYQSSLTYNNHVKITGLKPDTTYYYMPQDILANETVYGPYTFKTAKAAGDLSAYSIAYVADLGAMGQDGLDTTADKSIPVDQLLTPGEQNTIQSMASEIGSYDMLLHAGDLAYADYWLKMWQKGFINTTVEEGYQVYESILNEFYDGMEAVTANRPYMVGPGNHDSNCDNGGSGNYTTNICVPGQQNFTGYDKHFRMPSDISGGVGNMWYSFDYGSTHYVYFNTETDFPNAPGAPPAGENSGPFGSYPNQQLDWLNKDLAGVNRCKTPWVVALGHRPWFTSGGVCKSCMTAFAPIFEKYQVDLVLQGHNHYYERDLPVRVNGTLDPKGYNSPDVPVYIINGIAGHYGGMDFMDTKLQPYHAFGLDEANSVYGWSRIHFYNDTHLRHEFVASNNNTVLDTAVLYKDRSSNRCAATTPASSTKSAASPPAGTPNSSVKPTGSALGSSTLANISGTSSKPTGSSTSSTALSGASSAKPTGSAASSAVVGQGQTTVVSGNNAASTAGADMITSTVRTTSLITVTSCAPTVTNCPARSTTVITKVIDLYTTICPASQATATAISAIKTGTAAQSASSSGVGSQNSNTKSASILGSQPVSAPNSQGSKSSTASGSGKAPQSTIVPSAINYNVTTKATTVAGGAATSKAAVVISAAFTATGAPVKTAVPAGGSKTIVACSGFMMAAVIAAALL